MSSHGHISDIYRSAVFKNVHVSLDFDLADICLSLSFSEILSIYRLKELCKTKVKTPPAPNSDVNWINTPVSQRVKLYILSYKLPGLILEIRILRFKNVQGHNSPWKVTFSWKYSCFSSSVLFPRQRLQPILTLAWADQEGSFCDKSRNN